MPNRCHVYAAVLCAWVGACGGIAWAQPSADEVTANTSVIVAAPIDVADAVEEFERLVEDGRPASAVAVLQGVLEREPTALVAIGAGRYVSLSRYALQRITADEELLEAYRRDVSSIAAARLNTALRIGAPRHRYLELAQQFPASESALVASLYAAAASLEVAAFGDAAAILQSVEHHPDLAAHEPHWHALRGVVALVTGDEPLLRVSRTRLEALAAASALHELDRLAAALRPPETLAAPPHAELPLPEAGHEPAWSIVLESCDVSGRMQKVQSQTDRTWGILPFGRADPMWSPLPPLDTKTATHMPAVHEPGTLAINTGRELVAIELASGTVRWRRTFDDEALIDAARKSPRSVTGWHITDARSTASDGRRLFAVMDRLIGYPLGEQELERFGFSLLVAVDARTGGTLWQKRPADLDARLAPVALHGTPILHDGTLYVLGHTVLGGVHVQTHLIAVDATDGQLRFARRLAVTAEEILGSVRSYATLTLNGSRLYATDGLGWAACIALPSGQVEWLSNLQFLPGNDGHTLQRAKADFSRRALPPVVCGSGILISTRFAAASGGGPGAILLDAQTGAKRADLMGEPWDEPHTLAVADDRLVVVSAATVTAVKRADPRQVLWRASPPAVAAQSNAEDDADAEGGDGRPNVLTRDAVPGRVILRRRSGELSRPANLHHALVQPNSIVATLADSQTQIDLATGEILTQRPPAGDQWTICTEQGWVIVRNDEVRLAR